MKWAKSRWALVALCIMPLVGIWACESEAETVPDCSRQVNAVWTEANDELDSLNEVVANLENAIEQDSIRHELIQDSLKEEIQNIRKKRRPKPTKWQMGTNKTGNRIN